ncbi:Mediator of RNA polymerase II transcription subunit 20a [Linum perenne]
MVQLRHSCVHLTNDASSLTYFFCILPNSIFPPPFLTRVLHWQPNPGSTVNSQILNEVSQCAESINGVKDGRWKASLTLFRPILRDQTLPAEYPRELLGVWLPEQPNKYYFIMRGQRLVTEADSSIQTIMEKLQSYKSRIALYFEGYQYRLGDFQLRVGKVVSSHSENLRGIVLEVEYLPISSMGKASQVLSDFVDILNEAVAKRSLHGSFMHNEPTLLEYGLGDDYSSQHTAVQYASVMAQLISTQPGSWSLLQLKFGREGGLVGLDLQVLVCSDDSDSRWKLWIDSKWSVAWPDGWLFFSGGCSLSSTFLMGSSGISLSNSSHWSPMGLWASSSMALWTRARRLGGLGRGGGRVPWTGQPLLTLSGPEPIQQVAAIRPEPRPNSVDPVRDQN